MNDLAAMRYRVEYIESDAVTMVRRVAWQMAAPMRGVPIVRPPLPDPHRPLALYEADEQEIRRNAQVDVVRILDIEGNLVWFREHRSRAAAQRQHSEVMDDLMKLDEAAFRRKYAIIPERPIGAPAPAPAAAEDGDAPAPPTPTEASPPQPADPWGAWGSRLRQSEGGSEWGPAEPQRPSDPDITWDEWGQR